LAPRVGVADREVAKDIVDDMTLDVPELVKLGVGKLVTVGAVGPADGGGVVDEGGNLGEGALMAMFPQHMKSPPPGQATSNKQTLA